MSKKFNNILKNLPEDALVYISELHKEIDTLKEGRDTLPSENELQDLFAPPTDSVSDVYKSRYQLEGAKLVMKLIRNNLSSK